MENSADIYEDLYDVSLTFSVLYVKRTQYGEIAHCWYLFDSFDR